MLSILSCIHCACFYYGCQNSARQQNYSHEHILCCRLSTYEHAMNSTTQTCFLPVLFACVRASYHPIMYYCCVLTAESQIFRQRKGSLALRQPGSWHQEQGRGHAGAGECNRLQVEGRRGRIGQGVSGWSFNQMRYQIKKRIRALQQRQAANTEGAGMFHRNQVLKNRNLKSLTLRNLHNILRGTSGG
jgi:hypothetical protein